jgi:hypothetical protein
MSKLTRDAFAAWLEGYSQASIANDPHASAEIFTPDARYFESPFDDPITGREAIYAYWDRGARELADKTAEFEVIALSGNTGVARWRSVFTVIATGKRISLDCLFVAEFEETGRCSTFRERWHRREEAVVQRGR